ncbi:MAG: hypothetical protein ACQERX_05990 [Bacillota bacterium]
METKNNPDLIGNDKQFSIAAGVKDDKMLFHTDHKTQMDWLLEIDEMDNEVEITNKVVREVDGKEYIVGLSANIPIGYLSLKSSKRSNNNLSSTVSKPSTVANADFSWAE